MTEEPKQERSRVREFWIEYYKGQPREVFETKGGDYQLRVIEYAAYEKAITERDRAIADLEVAKDALDRIVKHEQDADYRREVARNALLTIGDKPEGE